MAGYKERVSKNDSKAAERAQTNVTMRFLVKNWVWTKVAKLFSELTTVTVTFRLHHPGPYQPKYGR